MFRHLVNFYKPIEMNDMIFLLHSIRVDRLHFCHFSDFYLLPFTFLFLYSFTNTIMVIMVNISKLGFSRAACCRKLNKPESEPCSRSQEALASLDERISHKVPINQIDLIVSLEQFVKHCFTMASFWLRFTLFSIDRFQFQNNIIHYLIDDVIALATIFKIFCACQNALQIGCKRVNFWLIFAFVCLFTRYARKITSDRNFNFLQES